MESTCAGDCLFCSTNSILGALVVRRTLADRASPELYADGGAVTIAAGIILPEWETRTAGGR